MATIFYREPELVIALNRKIIFLNPNDLQIFKEVFVPEDLTKHGLASHENAEQDNGKEETTPQKPPIVQNVRLSDDGKTLAVTTSGQKALLLYTCRPEHAKLTSVRPMTRVSSALAFGPDARQLLVTDKTGDCYQYNCQDGSASPRLLLGHLSIVYDILWPEGGNRIVTCDRDDKIRITNYPATYEIHGYCLGHKEFVSGLGMLEGSAIASVSGDRTLRIWDYERGEELAQMALPAPALRLGLRRLNDDRFQAAVLLHQPNESVGIYTLAKEADGSWQITDSGILSFPDVSVSDFCFVDSKICAIGMQNERLVVRVKAVEDGATAARQDWVDMVEAQFAEEQWAIEDVGAWFKKRYDNVSEYLERKKRRIEERQK